MSIVVAHGAVERVEAPEVSPGPLGFERLYNEVIQYGEAMKGRRLTVGLAALAALPLLYVAAYLALMQRMTAFPGRGVWVEYRVGGPVAEVIFAPANYLDRRMRPAYWDYWTLRGEIQYYAPGPDFVSGP